MTFTRWLKTLLNRRKLENELDEELRYHVERQIEENIAKGLTPRKARYAALRAFGHADSIKESSRDLWTGKMDRLIQDFRNAFRVVRRSPGFTTLAVLTLTVGIGGATAMFSIVNGVLLKPLDYRDPEELVAITAVMPPTPAAPLSAYYFAQWKQQSRTIDDVALAGFGNRLNLTGTGETEQVSSVLITANLFSLLGLQVQRGRNFLPAENLQRGTVPVAIISDGLWSRRFGRDPSTLGRTIELNGTPHEIVGILRPDVRFPKNDELHRMVRMPAQVDVWRPIVFPPQELQGYVNANYAGIARLKPGTSVSTAEAELDRILKQSPNMLRNFPVQIRLNPLRYEMVARVEQGLVVLMIAVSLVLAISCVNITNLLLARAANQRHEIAIRAALGASRRQLARGPIIESFVVAMAGAGAGTLLAGWLLDLIRVNTPVALPRVDEIRLDAGSLLFAVSITLISAVICGALPGWRFSRTNPSDALHAAGRGATSGKNIYRLRAGLVSLESALCVVLTILAGLLIHSFVKISGLDQGFQSENAFSANIQLFGPRYAEPSARLRFFHDVISGIEALPGTQTAGAVSALPLSGSTNIMGLSPQIGADLIGGGGQAEYRTATAGHFAAMNIPLLRGRVFNEQSDGPKTAVITETTARRLWPGQDPVGKRFERRNRQDVFTIVGVVGDVRSAGPDREPPLMAYTPLAELTLGGMVFVIRTSETEPAIRQVVAAIDKTISVSRILRMDAVLSNAFAVRRFQMMLTACFAAVALLLAAIGIYGVVSGSVTRRQKEIGIRLALGSQKSSIATLVLTEGLKPVLIGMSLGLIGAVFAAQTVESLLFGIAPFDFSSYMLPLIVLFAAAVAACWIPMRAAVRVDPMTRFRYE